MTRIVDAEAMFEAEHAAWLRVASPDAGQAAGLGAGDRRNVPLRDVRAEL